MQRRHLMELDSSRGRVVLPSQGPPDRHGGQGGPPISCAQDRAVVSGQHRVQARICWVHCGDGDHAFQAQHQHQRMVRGKLDVETDVKTKQGITAQNEID